METLEVRLRKVRATKKKNALGAKIKAQMWKSSIAKEILEGGSLVTYVRDKFGFKKGVVVAIDRGQVGWSLVAPDDHEYEYVRIEQIPVLSTILQTERFEDEDGNEATPHDVLKDFVTHPAFKEWSEQRGIIAVPKFDRATGIILAVDRARAYAAITPDQGKSFDDVPMPNDKELREALIRLNNESYSRFAPKEE
jgi:hypothetical protein